MATRFAPNGEKRGRDKGEVKVMRQSGGGGDRSNRHNYYCILLILLSAELQTDFRPTFFRLREKGPGRAVLGRSSLASKG